MSEGSDLRVGQAGEERYDCVHHVLVIDDTVLTLPDQNTNELTEIIAELLPLRPGDGEGVITTVLKCNRLSVHCFKGTCSI